MGELVNYSLLILIMDSFIIALFYFSLWFLYSLKVKRNDVADIAWGIGFVLIALGVMFINSNFSDNVILVTMLVSFWGFRLFLHIASRNVRKKEDVRYKKWRDAWRHFKLRSYFQVYLLQAALMVIISMSVIVNAAYNDNPLNIFSYIGLFIWVIGFIFEVLGDYQLDKFLKDSKNKGKVMDQGLWRYTRHPNYFGEVLLWWGIFVITIPTGYWWISVIGPITISFLILKVSGVPLAEKQLAGLTGWNDYKRKTSSFFPLPPKK